MKSGSYIKGRGAQKNTSNSFFEFEHEKREDFLEFCRLEGEDSETTKTTFLEVFPKTIVNKVTSPDVGMQYSMNPYQGCEHGCIYCYARNTHEYWGYSAGLDFEQKILVKKDAPKLLEQTLKNPKWKAKTIVLSGNTDCYQPAEKHYKITRSCLEVFLKYKHPVGIITKNALVLRDLDILKELAQDNLVAINISITSLSEDVRRLLEPRTATIKKRLETVRQLSEHNIPVNVMLAPIIPGINSHEILALSKAAAEHGARSIYYTIVRLNGAVAELFEGWIKSAMPDKAEKVLNQIKACHGGELQDNRFGKRMHGEGVLAKQIRDMISLARTRYFKNKTMPILNTELHDTFKTNQLRLF